MQLSARLTIAAALLAVAGVPALAQEAPEPAAVISPLRAEPDVNGVNLINGKKIVEMPVVLSAPAAPRLTFDRVQNARPYIDGTTGPGGSSWSVHYGGNASEAFKCDAELLCNSVTAYTYLGNTNLPLIVTQTDEATNATRVTTYAYDSAGRPTRIDGPLTGMGDARYFQYDKFGRKIWEVGELAPNNLRLAKRFTYRNSDDKVTKVETGTVACATNCDTANLSLTLLQATDTTYDSRRYPIRERTYKGAATRAVTDRSFLDRGLNDCTTVRMNLGALPAATATGACALGTQGSQGADRITKNSYDNAGQLTKVQKAYLTPDQADYVTYTYTPNGKQQFVTDANGNRARFVYDGFDRLYQWQFPSKTTPGQVNAADYEQYGYDANGNRTFLRKRDGATLSFTYDALNRMTSKVMGSAGGGNGGNGGNGGGTNQPPVANFDNLGSMSCGDTQTFNVVANDTDPDGNYPLSLVSASGSFGIVVTVATSTDIQILSTGASSGTKSFSYVIQDSLGAQDSGAGIINVTAPCN